MLSGKWLALVGLLVAGALQSVHAAGANCPPEGWSQDRLGSLKTGKFAIADAVERQTLALALLPCLSAPDPLLRDGLAFEAYSTWLRGDQLDKETRLAALGQLLPLLSADATDAEGFTRPFAALVLAELARADRKAAYLSAEQREQLVEAATRYLASVTDYRGFDATQGWRHGVAHGSDLLMQLSLNDLVSKPQLDRILAAVASQVAPAGEHFYIYGESERLARPALLTAMRGLHEPAEWRAWFAKLVSPAPMASWKEAFSSNAGLARRHNTRAFLLLVHAEIANSKNEKLALLLPEVNAALAAMQ